MTKPFNPALKTISIATSPARNTNSSNAPTPTMETELRTIKQELQRHTSQITTLQLQVKNSNASNANSANNPNNKKYELLTAAAVELLKFLRSNSY